SATSSRIFRSTLYVTCRPKGVGVMGACSTFWSLISQFRASWFLQFFSF
ncbi:hypothetical protein Hypma_005860, partial [Hypsizygus marmoreus]